MGGRTQPYDRLTGFKVIINIFHLVVGQFTKSSEDKHQVCGRELLKTRDVLLVNRIDIFCSGIQRNNTVQVNPYFFESICASIGNASSERYSSSPLTSTICFPL